MVHARALLSSASRLRTNRKPENLFADQRLVAGSGSEKDGIKEICPVAAIAPTVASILLGSSLAREDMCLNVAAHGDGTAATREAVLVPFTLHT